MLWRMRVEGDYDPAAAVPNERAEEAVSLASELLSAIEGVMS